MTIHAITTGIAMPIGATDAQRWEADAAPIRIYRDERGGYWVGTDTSDIAYYCDAMCMGDALRDDHNVDTATILPVGHHVFPSGTTDDAVTVEWGPATWSMPDYDVHCASCGDAIHMGDAS